MNQNNFDETAEFASLEDSKKETRSEKRKNKKSLKSEIKSAQKKAGGFWKDFKAFAFKGNVVDLAIAVIIGGAFGKIVTSVVNDLISPLISLALGNVKFSDLKWVIRATDSAKGTAEVSLYYGAFLQTVFDFMVIALCIFLAMRIYKAIKSRNLLKLATEKLARGGDDNNTELQAEKIAAETVVEKKKETQEEILKDIRELLKQQLTEKTETENNQTKKEEN